MSGHEILNTLVTMPYPAMSAPPAVVTILCVGPVAYMASSLGVVAHLGRRHRRRMERSNISESRSEGRTKLVMLGILPFLGVLVFGLELAAVSVDGGAAGPGTASIEHARQGARDTCHLLASAEPGGSFSAVERQAIRERCGPQDEILLLPEDAHAR